MQEVTANAVEHAFFLSLLRRHRYEHRAMPSYCAREFSAERAEVLLAPESANDLLVFDPELVPAHRDAHVHLVAVEQPDRQRAIRKRSRPYLELVLLRHP